MNLNPNEWPRMIYMNGSDLTNHRIAHDPDEYRALREAGYAEFEGEEGRARRVEEEQRLRQEQEDADKAAAEALARANDKRVEAERAEVMRAKQAETDGLKSGTNAQETGHESGHGDKSLNVDPDANLADRDPDSTAREVAAEAKESNAAGNADAKGTEQANHAAQTVTRSESTTKKKGK